jgi:hypothetical protein
MYLFNLISSLLGANIVSFLVFSNFLKGLFVASFLNPVFDLKFFLPSPFEKDDFLLNLLLNFYKDKRIISIFTY